MFRYLTTNPNFLIFSIVILALILRIPLLDGSFWLDEAAQALESSRPLSEQLLIREDFQPPGLHLLLHAAVYAGSSEWWLRTIGALIPGLLTVYFTYKSGLLLGTRRTAMWAALLLATSSFHIFYSQELRQYSLPAAFAAASWYLLILGWKNRTPLSNSHTLGYLLLTTGGVYSSYLYPFLVASQIVWAYLVWKKSVSQILMGVGGAVVLFLPWLPSFFEQLQVGTNLQAALPGWSQVVSPTQLRALPLVAAKFIYGVADVELNFIYGLTTALIAFLISLMCLKKLPVSTVQKSTFLTISIWLLIPILLAWLISFFIPVLQPKRVLFSLPALYLALAYLIEIVPYKKLIRSPANALCAVVLIINIITTILCWTTPALQRENWRALISDIETRYADNSVAVFAFDKPFAPWKWYASESFPVLATGEFYLSDETAQKTILEAYSYDHVLVFDYLRDLTDPERKLDSVLLGYGYQPGEVIDYPGIGFVRIYSKQMAVISYR